MMKKFFWASLSVIASPEPAGSWRGNLIKNSSMGFIVCCLAISAVLIGCTQRNKWETYKDPSYPITIGYIPDSTKMEVRASFHDGADPVAGRLEIPTCYSIDVDANFSEVHPNTEVLEGAYEIVIYKYEKDFKKMFEGVSARRPLVQEAILNGIPTILISQSSVKYETYILLVPGVYARVYLDGLSASEKLTREALKHFRWTQPIDTDSAEFKAWKTHIWDILKTPGQK